MKKNLLLQLILISTLFSCSIKKDEIQNQENSISDIKFTLIPIDTVSIIIDSLTSNYLPLYQYIETGGKKLFSIYNKNKHSIQIYDVSEKDLLKKIQLEYDGPEAVPDLLSFHIHNLDSVFLFSGEDNSIFLVDSDGVIVNSFELTEDLIDGNNFFEIAIEYYFETTFDSKNSILTFWAQPFIDTESTAYYQFPLVVDYNIETKKIVNNYGYYPESYRNDDIYFLREDLQRTVSSAYEVLHFSCAHEIYLYNITTKEFVRSAILKSEYLPDYLEPIMKKGDKSPTLQEQSNYHITQGRYRKLYYDRLNNLYYRFVRHPQELRTRDNLLSGHLDSKISVIISDDSFRFSGEALLPKETFIDFVSFVSDGIIWVNCNHPKSKLNTEDSFKFILYKPIAE